jgi:hypothetical protein
VIKTFELDFFKHNFEIKLASKHPHVAVEAPEKVAMNKYTFIFIQETNRTEGRLNLPHF